MLLRTGLPETPLLCPSCRHQRFREKTKRLVRKGARRIAIFYMVQGYITSQPGATQNRARRLPPCVCGLPPPAAAALSVPPPSPLLLAPKLVSGRCMGTLRSWMCSRCAMEVAGRPGVCG
jgi:hypothetical protein